MDFSAVLYRVCVSIIPLLIGIILHEIAHGYAALYCGDTTAKDRGRLSLNPIPHIDPMGSLVFFMTAIATPFTFGWAKPVPVNPRNFTRIGNVKKGLLIVSLAGPLTNLVLAFIFTLLLKIFTISVSIEFISQTFLGMFLYEVILSGIYINIILMVINLIPIPPLDGSDIIAYFLPYPYDYKYMSMGRYGMIILMLLLMTGIVGQIISIALNFLLPIFSSLL